MPRGMQVINGTEYVYEYDSTWDKGKKYGTHRRNYFGKIVNGEFAPNKKYELQLEFEESKKRVRFRLPNVNVGFTAQPTSSMRLAKSWG